MDYLPNLWFFYILRRIVMKYLAITGKGSCKYCEYWTTFMQL